MKLATYEARVARFDIMVNSEGGKNARALESDTINYKIYKIHVLLHLLSIDSRLRKISREVYI